MSFFKGNPRRYFTNKEKEIIGIVKDELEVAGRNTEFRAASVAPVDLGKLKQSIFYEPINSGLGARVTANVNYAPYVEFGTGGLVSVPKGFEGLAILFKGRGIKKVNLRARPYLIPSAKIEFRKLMKRLKQRLG